MRPEVSIVVLTRNAFIYCLRLWWSLRKTEGVDYEVVVVDNRSRLPVRLLVQALAGLRQINRLVLMDRNTLFAEGNNVGVAAGNRDAPYVLLLNSDVEVRDPLWLRRLIDGHRGGATSYGLAALAPRRADGYCFLIERDLYQRLGGLDEHHQWFWGITKLQGAVLAEGLPVRAVVDHDDHLVHFGGKSGKGHKKATGMDVNRSEFASLFEGVSVEEVPTVSAL